jgi:hypothetical protein
MDRAFPRVRIPAVPPDPEPNVYAVLVEIRDLLREAQGAGGGSKSWVQDYIDVPAGRFYRFPPRPGRKSLSLHNNGPGNAYYGQYPHLTPLTGMPIAAGAEREFEHEAEMYVIGDAALRLVYSEEWEVS